jgi:hypothetical protein
LAEAAHLVRLWLRQLGADRHGVAALEFAFCGLAFFGLTLFVISLGFRLYVQVALDYATSSAARMLAVDSTQSLSPNEKVFQAVTFCPLLSAFLSCTNITISLASVTDYRNGSAIGGSGPPPFSPGQGGSLMLLRASYLMPALGWPDPSGGGTAVNLADAARRPRDVAGCADWRLVRGHYGRGHSALGGLPLEPDCGPLRRRSR